MKEIVHTYINNILFFMCLHIHQRNKTPWTHSTLKPFSARNLVAKDTASRQYNSNDNGHGHGREGSSPSTVYLRTGFQSPQAGPGSHAARHKICSGPAPRPSVCDRAPGVARGVLLPWRCGSIGPWSPGSRPDSRWASAWQTTCRVRSILELFWHRSRISQG